MYTDIMKICLKEISEPDAEIVSNQRKFDAKDGFAELELYTSPQKISFRVKGDAYITAMIKWLQMYLLADKKLSLLNIEFFVEKFNLPEHKIRNAVLIMELVEQLR